MIPGMENSQLVACLDPANIEYTLRDALLMWKGIASE
jgi:hypothetical protein